MPIAADKLRELVGRGEGATIDFKRDQYDLNESNINAEIAKDVMAIANSLRANAEPGYLIIGVTDDGEIVGIPPTAHPDDAEFHRRISSHLHQTPRFIYSSVEVDGHSLGVFEIESIGRPYFPSKDSGTKLLARVALYRNGTTTERASPHLIQQWAREDDADAIQVRKLQLEEHEAERRIDAVLESYGYNSQTTAAAFTIMVTNRSRRKITVTALRWRLEWNPRFFRRVRETLRGSASSEMQAWIGEEPPPGYAPPGGNETYAIDVAPNTHGVVDVHWTGDDAKAHFRQLRLGALGSFRTDEARFHIEVDVEGELGNRRTLKLVVATAEVTDADDGPNDDEDDEFEPM